MNILELVKNQSDDLFYSKEGYYDMIPYRKEFMRYYKIYPKILCVAWLDWWQIHDVGFFKGEISDCHLEKLTALTDWGAFWQDSKDSRRIGKELIVFYDKVRCIKPCPICRTEIYIYNDELNIGHPLGMEDFYIPSADKRYLFRAPSLLLHFVREHNYLPPKPFLEAIEYFDMNQSFNCYNFNYWDDCIKVYKRKHEKYFY